MSRVGRRLHVRSGSQGRVDPLAGRDRPEPDLHEHGCDHVMVNAVAGHLREHQGALVIVKSVYNSAHGAAERYDRKRVQQHVRAFARATSAGKADR